jgi:hypothetical protein
MAGAVNSGPRLLVRVNDIGGDFSLLVRMPLSDRSLAEISLKQVRDKASPRR